MLSGIRQNIKLELCYSDLWSVCWEEIPCGHISESFIVYKRDVSELRFSSALFLSFPPRGWSWGHHNSNGLVSNMLRALSLLFFSFITPVTVFAEISRKLPTLALRNDGYLLKALASMSSLTSLPRSPQNIRKSSATRTGNRKHTNMTRTLSVRQFDVYHAAGKRYKSIKIPEDVSRYRSVNGWCCLGMNSY